MAKNVEGTGERVAAIADIEAYLGGVDYPAERDDLVNEAQSLGAPSEIVSAIENMPDEEYGTAADVARELRATQAEELDSS